MPKADLTRVRSWGRVGAPEHEIVAPRTIAQAQRAIAAPCPPWLACGMERSYGDVAMNAGGRLIDCTKLDRFISFDRGTGILEAEAGVSLESAIRLTLPHGWFLPTTPGTKFVTLAGAVANDVHGKNHHHAGTFGSWVRELEIVRSDGSVQICSLENDNAELFCATIGGLGLTGFISRVKFQLEKIRSAYLDSEDIAFGSLDEFFALAESSGDWQQTVAWMDCVGAGAGRGIFSRANWSETGDLKVGLDRKKLTIPVAFPEFALNSVSVKLFNTLLFRLKSLRARRSVQHYDPFFYPLDSIGQWNLMYGNRGFFQYQCVIPKAVQRPAMAELLKEIAGSGQASFLAVIKLFADKPSPGMLSFPMPGTNLALDFPNRGENTKKLFERMDAIVAQAGGRIYPAKDARMPAGIFRSGYPQWTKLAALKDPAVHSDFWTRVTA